MTFSNTIVSVKWLYNNLENKNLIVLDGTINKVFDTQLPQIPKARFFDIKQKFSDTSGAFPSTFPSQEQFQAEAQNLGIHNHSIIVVYDDKGIYSSARVWWLFKAFGFNNIAVLDGGFPEWLKHNLPTEPMVVYHGEKGNFTATLQPEYMMFFNDVKIASLQKTHTIVDARSSARFNGEVPEPRAGLRSGTIPNSINLPFTNLLNNGLFKPKKEVEDIFSKTINKTPNEPIIFSCGSGITACVLALGAEMSGYNNIAVYDGSWTEWGTLTTKTMDAPSTWTKEELLAYILIYVANSDLKESWKEHDYILNRVDEKVYKRMHQQFETDNDYQSIQNIVEAVKTHDYFKNDLTDLFADIKLMAFADGDLHPMEEAIYNQLRKILREA
ncbi:sulfurtransferase [Seonamhaeicola sp. NFXS20]|uniref:sulfurtransferase n=1 Tax=Seonamhaeicola sp. NFXS20 TaxID=2816959 RepID=UPI003B8DA48E